MLPRFLFSLMMATSIVWPFMPSRLRMGRRSTCEPGRKARAPVNVDGQAALDALHDDALDRLLLVVGPLDLVPCAQPLRLLVREVDVALFGFALVAHHVDFVAGLELRLALVIEHFRERHHAFGLRADIDDHVGAGQLQHGAFDDVVFADRFLGFGGEVSRAAAKSSLAAALSSAELLVLGGWRCVAAD